MDQYEKHKKIFSLFVCFCSSARGGGILLSSNLINNFKNFQGSIGESSLVDDTVNAATYQFDNNMSNWNKYYTNYFGDIDSKYVSGGDLMWQLIMKYRKAFYDYIYKSRTNAITSYMFDEMMQNSILTNILQDEIKTRCEYNNAIKKKINIWFSIYNLFNNNKKVTIMASNVTELLSKMKSVTQGESNIETPEEFAFGAGQLASYLIDRSAASNKTYAMLEPYLQKSKSGQLQDAIAQTIAVYKHDISVYKGNFEMLAAQVLTYDCNADMKPLLKYFLAGCFSHCIIYKGKNESNKQ